MSEALNSHQNRKEKHVEAQLNFLEDHVSKLSNQVKHSKKISTHGATSQLSFGTSALTSQDPHVKNCTTRDKTTKSKKTPGNYQMPKT